MTRVENDGALIAGRFQVEHILGRGGMGQVFAAVDRDTGARIALKRIITDVPQASALFEREYRTLASLRHPRIVEVYEYGVDAQGAFYTMELLEGSDLNSLAPMPWREVCAPADQLARLAGEMPSFDYHARSAMAAYHVMRGRPQEALDIMEGQRADMFVIGSARTRSVVASAYSALGRHREALDVCDAALAELSEDDLAYFGLNGTLQVERCLALAALGEHEQAAAQLDGLLALHGDTGELIPAYLRRARAEVALLARDLGCCHVNVGRALDHAKRAASPSLIAWVRDLEWKLENLENACSEEFHTLAQVGAAQLAQGVRLMLQHPDGAKLDSVYEKVLRISRDLSGAKTGFLVAQESGESKLVDCGESFDTELQVWAEDQMLSEPADEATEVLPKGGDAMLETGDACLREVDGVHYRLTTIHGGAERHHAPTAVMVLGAPGQAPARIGHDVLVALGRSLSEFTTPDAGALVSSSVGLDTERDAHS